MTGARTVGPVAQAIGASDCERLADAFLAQPANTVTSLTYAVVAGVILLAARPEGRPGRLTATYAALLAAVGVGSALFHGPQPAGSRLLHDLPIVVLLLLMVLHDLSLVRPSLRGPVPFIVGSVGAAVATVAVPDLAPVLTGALAAVFLVLEAIVFRRGVRDAPHRREVHLYAVMGTILGVAVPFWVLGRTGSPLCEPDAALQLHGLWHVASALVFGLWWWMALAPSTSPWWTRQPETAPARGEGRPGGVTPVRARPVRVEVSGR